MATAGILYLIPNILADGTAANVMASTVADTIRPIRYFAVEEIRSARRLLRGVVRDFPIDDSTFYTLTKNSKPEELKPMLKALRDGHDLAVISEAGCPGIADPGALLVAAAHQARFRVAPITGPSSFVLALMASGLNGQSFTFSGYLPINETERVAALKKLEDESRKLSRTQLFMDTPYRNISLWQTMLKVLNPDTMLCVAAGLTGPDEYISTRLVRDWQQVDPPKINKIPAVFLLLATV